MRHRRAPDLVDRTAPCMRANWWIPPFLHPLRSRRRRSRPARARHHSMWSRCFALRPHPQRHRRHRHRFESQLPWRPRAPPHRPGPCSWRRWSRHTMHTEEPESGLPHCACGQLTPNAPLAHREHAFRVLVVKGEGGGRDESGGSGGSGRGEYGSTRGDVRFCKRCAEARGALDALERPQRRNPVAISLRAAADPGTNGPFWTPSERCTTCSSPRGQRSERAKQEVGCLMVNPDVVLG